MATALEQLKERLKTVVNIYAAESVLGWDQQTYMPSGGATARAEQLATLSKIAHQTFICEETRKLLELAAAELNGADPDSDDASLVRVARRDYDLDAKVPAELVAEMRRTTSLAQEAWVKARQESNFSLFEPILAKILELTRQIAEHRGYDECIYDALLAAYEPGTTARDVQAMFDGLRPGLVELVRRIKEAPRQLDDSVLRRHYPKEKQIEFTNKVAAAIGFDFARGRQDQAAHPFCTTFSVNDVRITTRFHENHLSAALFATIHETGHALYELGSPERFDGTYLRGGTSLGVHESQSRLWENIVGRSLSFWKYYYPQLQAVFPDQLSDCSVQQFYEAINKVEPSMIRVEADEVTYNLHILLRFEIENDMLEGRLKLKDVPEAWNAKMDEYLGVRPANDAEGCLQDVHWAHGIMGYFPTYSIGNLLSAQLWEKAQADLGDTDAQFERGDFAPLLTWLRDNVHQHARKFLPQDLAVRVTGRKVTPDAFLRYINAKYTALYNLS